MDLTFQAPGQHHFVRYFDEQGIQISDVVYTRSLLLAADQLLAEWAPQSLDELQTEHLGDIFKLRPDLVLLGTGSKQRFPPAEFLMEFHQRGVGIEVMGTAAACRTFNVLVAESRRVVAALLPLSPAVHA
jgi:uncharacterized protein